MTDEVRDQVQSDLLPHRRRREVPAAHVVLADAFNPFDAEFMLDPGPVLEYARRSDPVFFSPLVNAWVVSRYDDVAGVLRDPDRFTSKEILSIKDLLSPEVSAYFGDKIPMEGTLIGVDRPQHTRLRRVLQQAFTPGQVNQLEPGLGTLVGGIVERIRPEGTADLLRELAYPLPLVTISRLIGITDEEMSFFRQAVEDWSALTVAYIQGVGLDDQMILAERIMGMHERVLELLEERRAAPKDDLLSLLVAPNEENLTDHELLSLVPGLFLAGHETTANVLANALWHLLSVPGRWERLVNDPSTIEATVEEILRLDTSVLGMWRNVTADSVIADVNIPAGQRLYLAFWSANRDDTRFSRPDEFDPERSNVGLHLAFGRGIHFCIGAALARLELRVALTVLAESLPTLHIAAGFVPAYRPHFFLRGLDSLWASW
jgi:cytochrome P450